MAASTPLVVLVVLIAAVLHAGWNAIAKAMSDGFSLFTRMSVAVVVIGFALVWLVDPPHQDSWPWLAASAAVHVAYMMGLLVAYRLGDFNQTYPLARGLGPMVVAIVAATLIDEPLALLPALGVVIIGAAIAVLGLTPWRRIRHNRAAIAAAVLTGLTIATYTLLDGIGVRNSGSAARYTIWLLTAHSAGFVITVKLLRHSRWIPAESPKPTPWLAATGTAIMSMLAYGLVLWAQTKGTLAAVAALRESSVVVAALLGAVLFREPMGRIRVGASVAVAVGVVLLALG
ncbi:EamA family transporter [Phytoactinopolyspora endophytica]|uniref:EamA family transporter n=1 Tax=Phytoactinopolyspora endophytica TaxID=1642495 RepID=UPI00101D01CC|nr:EamA family transporter [Phytoactinopolyspora endophytica]